MSTKIQINKKDITIRPSALDTYTNCAYQWALVFLGGGTSIPNSRATIGTGIHGGVEAMWTEVMLTKDKESANLSMAQDAAVAEFQDQVKDYGIQYGDGEDQNTCESEIVIGVEAFIDDVVPFTDIPKAVEKRYTIEMDHALVKNISGTVDYISDNTIGDIKTSKRKIAAGGYDVQQSVYKMLAEANGEVVDHNRIQGVVLTKSPYGMILDLQPNIPKAKYIINNLLDTLDVLVQDIVPAETLFRGNPKYYLCSPKYCGYYNVCPFVNGDAEPAKPQQVKL